jgi:hypothetical protein
MEWSISMLTKILSASVLTIGLATAALAQSASADNAAGATSGVHHHHRRHAAKAVAAPDQNATYSIGGRGPSMNSMNSNAD